jgi:hypothetical protein
MQPFDTGQSWYRPIYSPVVSLDVSSATGQLRLLAYIPDRSKQQGRRFPLVSISQALSIRFKRVARHPPFPTLWRRVF